MKLNAIYIERLNKEIKDTERKILIQEQSKADAIECSKIDIRQNIENGFPAVPFDTTIEHIKEIESRIEELKNHIVYLNNILIKGEL